MSTNLGGQGLPLLGAYSAKRCSRRTHNAFDPSVPAPGGVPEAVQLRMDEGRAFEAEVIVPALEAAHGYRCVSIAYGDHLADKQRRIDETLAAMEAGAKVIIGCQLPDDTTGGRTGSPDVLFRTRQTHSSSGRGLTPNPATYVPVDIKNHKTLERAERGKARVTGLSDTLDRHQSLRLPDAPGWSHMTSHRREDAMQLAHYTRMLQAMGRLPIGHTRFLAGVIGTSDFTEVTGERYGVVWYDLKMMHEKTWSATAENGWVRRSVLDVYDHEFALRSRVAQAARNGEELVRPYGKAECDECPYAAWCHDYVGENDPSFTITTGRLTDREWRYLYEQGLGTLEALAAASPTGPLAVGFQEVASNLPSPERRLSKVVWRARMHRDGVALERTSTGHIVVPAADVEIDFDVEWHPADGHVYQWGARVRYDTDESTATYEHSVSSFDVLDDASAYALAQEFFAWMEDFVEEQETAGRTVGIYHWTTPETRLATKMLGGDRAERLFEGRFTDLKAFMAQRFFARDGFSLKVVAPIFGFSWRASDAGGMESVLKIDQARDGSDPITQAAAREWLLAYNEDDCAAQAAIRDGLRLMLATPSPEPRSEAGTAPVLLEAHDHADIAIPEAAVQPEDAASRHATQGETVPSKPSPASATSPPIAVTSEAKADGRGVGRSTRRSERALSLDEIRNRVARFVVDYKNVKNEKQNTGDFWRAFMRCYGVEDSYLQGVTFEYPARRSDTGGAGYIDVFLPGVYLIEQKSEGKIVRPKGSETSNAEQQANAYLTGGDITANQMPRWVVTSDFATIQVTDLSALRKSPTRTKTIRTADLIDHVELFLFLTGQDSEALIAEEQAEASITAARLMGDLYAAMTGDDDTDGTNIADPDEEDDATMEASILLTRLLFLMFGDDAGLWPKGLFQRFIETRTAPDGSDLGPQLTALFNALDTPEPRPKRMEEALRDFPYVNGALFRHDDTKMTWFDTAMREALLDSCNFDWSRISPAVFGSLFQTVKSKAARRSDGEHYTSEANILKILRPMFLDDLRARLEAANTKPALEKLHAELRHFRYVDPACGCGNFLIVAYREMRALELDLLVKLQTKRGRDADLIIDPSDLLNVRLDQFYGIELNWWPAKIAETAMFLVDHQANERMAKVLGYTPKRLPIEIAANINHANALTTDWNAILPEAGTTTYMFGNPPFLGHYTRTPEQTAELQAAWGTKSTGHLDFVTAWHAKAITYMADKTGEFGFVTTNSITQGEVVPDLFPRLESAGWRIKFAHRTFPWNSESASKDKAAVHCVIIGFTRDGKAKQRLFDYPVAKGDPVERKVLIGINGYLVDAPNVYALPRSKPLSADLPAVAFGSMANDGKNNLLIPADQYTTVMADPVAAKYVRRFVGAKELISNLDRWCLWLVDLDPADVPKSPVLRTRLEAVKRKRLESDRATTKALAATPALFGEIRQPTVPYLCIPRHFAEGRPYATVARFQPDVIAGDANFTCPDPDGFGFAIISSTMFMTWQKTVGGRLKSDPRFAGTGTWNTLPLPPVDATTRASVIKAGEAVLAARSLHPERSLADHYQPLAMDPELVKAHRALDRVVDKAFGAPRGTSTEAQRQAVLFARYAELTAGLTEGTK